MRTVNVETLTTNIKEMCIQANHYLAPDMAQAMKNAYEKETKPLAKQILGQLLENLDIAGKDMIPICQETGMAVVFLKIGQDVHFEGGSVEDAALTVHNPGLAEEGTREEFKVEAHFSDEFLGNGAVQVYGHLYVFTFAFHLYRIYKVEIRVNHRVESGEVA